MKEFERNSDVEGVNSRSLSCVSGKLPDEEKPIAPPVPSLAGENGEAIGANKPQADDMIAGIPPSARPPTIGGSEGLELTANPADAPVSKPSPPDGGLEIHDLGFAYDHGKFQINIGGHLKVPRGTSLGLIGPSGSGKSTLMKLIGGILRIQKGSIRLDGLDITHLEPGTRPTLTVFQDLALLPHLSVEGNIQIGLRAGRRLKLSKGEWKRKVEDIIRRLNLEEFRQKLPENLSGGQRQRTALARAVVLDPSVLLLDEPTASLDVEHKAELSLLLAELFDLIPGMIVVIVTHDFEFAFANCDRLAIIKSGYLIAEDETERLFLHPPSVRVAEILDCHTILHGRLHSDGRFLSDDRLIDVSPAKMNIAPPDLIDSDCGLLVRSCAVSIRPSRPEPESGMLNFEGQVQGIWFRGPYTRVAVQIGHNQIIADIPDQTPRSLGFARRQTVYTAFSLKDVRVVPVESFWSGSPHSSPNNSLAASPERDSARRTNIE